MREGNGAGVEAGLRGGVGGGGDCGGKCGWCRCGDGGGGEETRRVKAVGLPVCEEYRRVGGGRVLLLLLLLLLPLRRWLRGLGLVLARERRDGLRDDGVVCLR